jgi:hypothetical protein
MFPHVFSNILLWMHGLGVVVVGVVVVVGPVGVAVGETVFVGVGNVVVAFTRAIEGGLAPGRLPRIECTPRLEFYEYTLCIFSFPLG